MNYRFNDHISQAVKGRARAVQKARIILALAMIGSLVLAILAVAPVAGAMCGGVLAYKIAQDLRFVDMTALANERRSTGGIIIGNVTVPNMEHVPSENPRMGHIYLANDSQFVASHYHEALTEYIVGWPQAQNLQQQLDMIAPPVVTNRRFDFKLQKNDQKFLAENDDVRAPGAKFKVITVEGEEQQGKTKNKGLTIIMDKDDVGGVLEEQALTRHLFDRVVRCDMVRAGTALQALGTANAKTWDATEGKDPDMDVTDIVLDASGDSGVQPNTLIYGAAAWTARVRSLRAQQHAGGMASSGFTPQQVAEMVGVETGFKSDALYATKKGGAKTRVIGSKVIACYLSPFATKEDPSNVKLFWTPCENGERFRVYRQETDKFLIITVEHYSLILSPTGLGAKRIDVSAS